jgi:isoleucyl-tRNA synthetase
LRNAGKVSVQVDGAEQALGADELIVTQTPRFGWTVASDAGETVGLEVEITPELRREGLAREVIRLVQEARKNDGLHVSDRIRVRWEASEPELSAALAEHGELIAGEVLADEFRAGTAADLPGGHQHADPGLGLTFWLTRA